MARREFCLFRVLADENKFGWNTDEIIDYNNSLGDEVIEVRARQFFPSSTDAPYLEFKNLS